ncbi:MAG: hypothetical protein Aurels2KO_25750 [Aureliella sp.]
MSTEGPTQQKKIRIDRGFELVYPQQPDSRGRARVVVKRKSYYLGEHGSAASYAMFARWKADFEATGSPTAGSTYRDAAMQYLGGTPRAWWRSRKNVANSLAIACICIVLTAAFTTWIHSSPPVPEVDGIVLTAREMDYVRGTRRYEADRSALNSGERVAEVSDMLSKEGLPRERLPHIVARPPLGGLD